MPRDVATRSNRATQWFRPYANTLSRVQNAARVGRHLFRTVQYARDMANRVRDYTSNRSNTRNPTSRRYNPAVDNQSNGMTGSSLRNVKVSKRTKKPAVKKNKKVKISPEFKAKVNKAIASKAIHGYFQANQIEAAQVGLRPNMQSFHRLPNQAQPYAGSLFNPTRIMYVAARLWNNRAASLNYAFPHPDNFDEYKTDIHVKKQWWKFRARNNTERTLFVTVYLSTPKKNTTAGGDPVQAWDIGLIEMAARGELIGKQANALGFEQNRPLVETLYTTPELSNNFRDLYKNSKTCYTVEPGQSFEWSVNGPQMKYEYSKMYHQDIYQPFQKCDIWQTIVVHLDTTSFLEGGVAHARVVNQLEHQLIVESTYHCFMECPARAGQDNPSDTNLTAVHDVKCIDDWTSGPLADGSAHRVDETNPQGDDNPE